jgi:hypothetical protein
MLRFCGVAQAVTLYYVASAFRVKKKGVLKSDFERRKSYSSPLDTIPSPILSLLSL